GLDVLAAFRNRSGSLSNADLALHTGLSRPTVSRLTYTLAQLGYLKRDAKGRFQLGLGILAAAYPVLSALKVRQLARPLMRDLARRMAARDFWCRRAAVPHAVGRLPFGQLRHSLVSFQCRTDRARMRAAHAGPGAQHPLAGGQRLNTPERGAKAHRSTGAQHMWGGKNGPDQNRAGLRRGFC